MKQILMTIGIFCLTPTLWALPGAPTDPAHPGSQDYQLDVIHESTNMANRKVDVYLPTGQAANNSLFPVVVFGHGQALDASHYQETFEHLARKGIAVIHPMYDNGFFDQDWRRMADDFNQLTQIALDKYPNQLDPQQVVYSGHSKGGYIALMAASKGMAKSLVLFAPAGYDSEYLANTDPSIPMTLVWGEADTIISRSDVWEIYSKAPLKNKQFIDFVSYSSRRADHFFPLSQSTFLGGQNGISPFHFWGVWKLLIGAAWDVENKSPITDEHIYGEGAADTGQSGLSNKVTRSW